MKCLAVCQDELLIRTLHQVLAPKFEIEFLVENKPLARRLHEAGLPISVADPRRCDSYLKCDLSPNNCVLIQDSGRRSLTKIIDAARDAGGTLIYVIGTAEHTAERETEI